MPVPVPVPVIVLAGGRGRRMGGVSATGTDKAALTWRGRPLLDHVLDAAAPLVGDGPTVVVGPPRPVPEGARVLWTREEPAGGGPAAGLLAGLDALDGRTAGPEGGASAGQVLVVAVDMPGLSTTTLEALLEAATGHDGAVLTRGGRRQLAMALDPTRVRATAPPPPYVGLPLHRLLARLDLAEVGADDRWPEEGADVDTRSDLARLDGVTVDAVGEDHWRRWARVRLSALADAPEAFGSALADWADAGEDRWRERLASPGRCLLARRDHEDVGMAAVTPAVDGVCELISMWVAPPARGRGVSDLLLDHVAAHAAEAGAAHLELVVREHNRPARAAYARLGFTATRRVVDPDAPLLRRELVMRLEMGARARDQ